MVGYALPLRSEDGDGRITGRADRGCFRREQMYLIPGDSPMGMRLPLDSLPWAPADEREPFYELRPHRRREIHLPPQAVFRCKPRSMGHASLRAARRWIRFNRSPVIQAESDPSHLVRTALCVEPRQGRLHVFLPPVRLLEDYLELVAVVEDNLRRTRSAGSRRRLPAAAAITG